MKKSLLLLVMLLTVLMSVSVFGAINVTMTFPIASSTVNGTFRFNATAINGSNVTFLRFNGAAYSTICTNSTVTNVGVFSCVYDTTGLSDGASFVVIANASNSSNTSLLGNANVTVDWDNTAPTVQFNVYKSSSEIFKPISYDCGTGTTDTVDSALTWGVQLVRPDETVAETLTSSSGDFLQLNLDQVGLWRVSCNATDNVPRVTQLNSTLLVKGKGLPIEITQATVTSVGSSRNRALLVGLAGLFVIVGGVIAFMMVRKK